MRAQSIILVMAMLSSGTDVSAQKPVVDMPIIADYPNQPATLEAFVERADAVVIATVGHVQETGTQKRPKTEYQMTVGTTLKEHRRLEQGVRICRPGIGSVEYPDRIVRKFQPGVPDISRRADYLVFLKWDDSSACFTFAFGAPSIAAFNRDGRVSDMARHPVIQALHGLDKAEVAKHIAEAKRR